MDVFLQLSGSDRVFLEEIFLPAIDEVSLSVSGRSELADFFKILGLPEIKGIPERYVQLCETLGLTGRGVLQVIPAGILKDHIKDAINALQNTLCETEAAEYLVTYLSIKRFLQGLQKSCIDPRVLSQLIGSTVHETTRSALNSFMPDEAGHSDLIRYSMINTVTGRMTVESGPQILTAPAEVRKCIKSRYVSGKILQIDIVSVEPKFALHVSGKTPPKDVYSHIARVILENRVSRSQAKLITLCALYGQSARKLAEQLPEGVNPRHVIQRTRQFFDSDRLESRLKSERRNGMIRNVVGRPIRVLSDDSHRLISYYLQSSAAEGSLLMFARFIQETDLTCIPLYVIHDALILDCEEKSAQRLLDDDHFKFSLGDWEFDAKIKQVGDN